MKVKIAIAVAAVLALLTAAMTVPHLWQPSGASEASEKKGDEEQAKNGIVALDEQKLASLELKVEPAGVQQYALARDRSGVSAPAQQVDLDKVRFSAQHVTLFPQVQLPTAVVGRLVARA